MLARGSSRMLGRHATIFVLGLALVGCSIGISDLNAKPTKYYQESISIRGRVSRVQRVNGEVIFELADAQEHRLLVRTTEPFEMQTDDWVNVKGIFVPEARVGDHIVYDLLQAEEVSPTRAPWLRNLF
jgi:hypothetical protein